jgi:hypothetical protein
VFLFLGRNVGIQRRKTSMGVNGRETYISQVRYTALSSPCNLILQLNSIKVVAKPNISNPTDPAQILLGWYTV